MEAGAAAGAVRAVPGGEARDEPVGVPLPPAKLTGLAALDTVAAQAQLRVETDTEGAFTPVEEPVKRASVVEVPHLVTMWPPHGTPERTAFVRRTAASWALLGAMIALYLTVFTSMGAGPRVYLYLLPATDYSLVRAHVPAMHVATQMPHRRVSHTPAHTPYTIPGVLPRRRPGPVRRLLQRHRGLAVPPGLAPPERGRQRLRPLLPGSPPQPEPGA